MLIPVRLKKCEVDLLAKLLGKVAGSSRSSLLRSGLAAMGHKHLKREKKLLEEVDSMQGDSWRRYGHE